VYVDDFGAATGGWYTGASSTGSSAAIRDRAYEITPARGHEVLVDAPYDAPISHLSVAVDVQLPASPSTGVGAVVCGWPNVGHAHYEFAVDSRGAWAILKAPQSTMQVQARPILSGRLAGLSPGQTVHVEGVCSDQSSTASARITHLAMFVNGAMVGQVDDELPGLPGTQWRTGLSAAEGESGPIEPVRFTHFVIRDSNPPSATAAAARSWAPLFVLAALALVIVGLSRLSRARRRRAERRARVAAAASAPPAAPPTSPWGFPVPTDDRPPPR